jgi:hypothetical protein
MCGNVGEVLDVWKSTGDKEVTWEQGLIVSKISHSIYKVSIQGKPRLCHTAQLKSCIVFRNGCVTRLPQKVKFESPRKAFPTPEKVRLERAPIADGQHSPLLEEQPLQEEHPLEEHTTLQPSIPRKSPVQVESINTKPVRHSSRVSVKPKRLDL